MESRNHSNNISFIRKQARLTEDKGLEAVVIDAASMSKHRVSQDHFLEFVTAVDEEIARLETLKISNDDLLELYRIRYESVLRLKNHIMKNAGIADNAHGQAIRAYLYLHASTTDIQELTANKIYPISIPEDIKQKLVSVGNAVYSTSLYYLLNFLVKDNNPVDTYNNLFRQRYAQKHEQIRERYHPHDESLAMDFSLIDGIEPILNKELTDSIPQTLNDDIALLADGRQSPERIEVLGADNLNLLAEIQSYFESAGKFLPEEQLRQYQELQKLLDQHKNSKDFFSQLKTRMPFIKYCHSQVQKEKYIRAVYLQEQDKNAAWYQTWTRREKYANTGAEWLPHLLKKLNDVEHYLDALIKVINESKHYPAEEKAQDFVNIRKTKAVIKKERELIHESMLARLEIIHKHYPYLLFARLRAVDPHLCPLDANIVDDTFSLLPDAIRNKVSIDKTTPEAYFSADMVKHFFETIEREGSDEHKARLLKITDESIVKQHDASVTTVEDYEHPEFTIRMDDEDQLNLHYIVTDNYISPAAFQADVEKMKDLRRIIDLGVQVEDVAIEDQVVVELESDEMNNKIFIYNLFDGKSLYMVQISDDIFKMPQSDRQFFAMLFTEKSQLPDAAKKLFILMVAGEEPLIRHHLHFKELSNILFDDEVPTACFEKFMQLVERDGFDKDQCAEFLELIESIRRIEQKDKSKKLYAYVANMASFADFKKIDAKIEAFKKAASQKQTELDSSFHLSNSDSDSEETPLPIKRIDALISSKPPKRNKWLPWILVGMVIGFVVAAAVVASIASFGIVPAGITLGVGIGAAVCLTTASTITGGFIGAFVKKCKDFFASLKFTSSSNVKPYKPESSSYKRFIASGLQSAATIDAETKQEQSTLANDEAPNTQIVFDATERIDSDISQNSPRSSFN